MSERKRMTDGELRERVELACDTWGDLPAWLVNEVRRARASEERLAKAADKAEMVLSVLLELQEDCGDRNTDCPLANAHKPGTDFQEALSALRSALAESGVE